LIVIGWNGFLYAVNFYPSRQNHNETFGKGAHYVIPAEDGIQKRLKKLDSVSSTE
jgi:hypothetical protein